MEFQEVDLELGVQPSFNLPSEDLSQVLSLGRVYDINAIEKDKTIHSVIEIQEISNHPKRRINAQNKTFLRTENYSVLVEPPENDYHSKSFECNRNINDLFLDESNKQVAANPFSVDKKWALCQICQLGIDRGQVIQSLFFLKGLPDDTTKESMFNQVIEHIFQDQNEPVHNNGDHVLSSSVLIDHLHPEPQQNAAPMIDKKDEVTCDICFETITANNQLKKPLPCDHVFCHYCYINYFNDKINTNDVLDVKCPEGDCGILFADEQVQTLLNDFQFNKYKRLKEKKIVNQNSNVRWCTKRGCEKYVVGVEGVEKVQCECGTEICFKCGGDYHPARTCDEMVDGSYKAYMKQNNVLQCPKCRSGVEKADGCNHMTCCVCKYQWCWLCGAKYSSAHFSRLNPLGCGGLQRGSNTRSKWPLWRIYIQRFFIFLFFLLLVALSPIAFVVFSILLPYLSTKHTSFVRRGRYGRRKSGCTFFLIVIGIVLLPIWMIVLLCYGVCFVLSKGRRRRR